MLSSRFLALLLPVLAAAAPAPSVSPANTHVSPAIALENRFKAVHDAHHAEKKGLDIRILDRGDVFDAPITGVVTTRNELVNKSCAPIIVIFARGTTEPGNVGDDVGPQFFDALAALRPGRTIVQGVNNYDASVWEYLNGGSDDAAANMAASVKLAATQCPTAKVVLSGFSQGAQVTHKAAALLPSSLYKLVGAIVLFGDPDNGDAFPGTLNNNVKSFCHDGDFICEEKLPIVTKKHGTYENDSKEAAAYVASILV